MEEIYRIFIDDEVIVPIRPDDANFQTFCEYLMERNTRIWNGEVNILKYSREAKERGYPNLRFDKREKHITATRDNERDILDIDNIVASEELIEEAAALLL